MNSARVHRNLRMLLMLLVSMAQAEALPSAGLKTIGFHGIRATDPDGRMGLRNPERGLRYESRIGNAIGDNSNHMGWIRAMQAFAADGMTLSQTYCYLDAFVDKPLSQEKLDWLQRDFDLLRKYGFKCLLRFAYQHGTVKGPEKKWVLHHRLGCAGPNPCQDYGTGARRSIYPGTCAQLQAQDYSTPGETAASGGG